jgi:5S rRNA maturation endonuclease (ribonuclease M5)
LPKIDFQSLAWELASNSRNLLPEWLPGGKFQGKEYACSDLKGGNGKSLCVNIETGQWMDHANSEVRGGDLISLYAAIHNIKQGEAAERLSPSKPQEIQEFRPKGLFWKYNDKNGNALFYVTRRETPQGKQYTPYHLVDGKWTAKAYPEPRPLYGLDILSLNPTASVVVVEGEKSADACRKIMGSTCLVTTWSHGANSVYKNDWSVLKGRKILIWPDADDPGKKAAQDIAGILSRDCEDIKIINPKDKPLKWDAADALNEGMTYEKFVEWASPLITTYVAEPIDELKPTVSLNVIWDELSISRNGNGVPFANLDNGLRVLDGDKSFEGKIWWDEFHNKVFTSLYGEPEEWSDLDTYKIVLELQRRLGITKFSTEMAFQAIYIYAHKNSRNEPKDWMESLLWDGNERLDGFFADYFGCKRGYYAQAISKNFWISMVARIFDPGCKVDNMVILEGKQETFKTMSLRIIGGKWYVSLTASVMSNDFYEVFQGKMIAEIAEMESFGKAEATKIKAMLTTQSDRYREKYGRHASEHPRQCIFAGTTNEKHYFKDTTGNRRFWPIRVSRINVEDLKKDRDQLFAEAVKRYKSGEKWFNVPLEETKAEQDLRTIHDEWEEAISKMVSERYRDEYGLTTSEIADGALNITIDKMNGIIQKRIGQIMHNLGFDQQVRRVEGSSRRRWFKE